jgi:hypothetical protein
MKDYRASDSSDCGNTPVIVGVLDDGDGITVLFEASKK